MHTSDDIRVGPVYGPAGDFGSSGNPSPMELGVGPVGRAFIWDIVPAALNATGLATAQAATGGIVALTAGAGVTLQFTNPDGVPRYILDVPRAVTLTAAGANTQVAVVRGYDYLGQPMSESFAAPSTNTVTGKKAFKAITSITFAATPGSNVSAGTANIFGLPYRIVDAGYALTAKWKSVFAQDTGTLVLADQNTATSATGDVRGTYAPSDAADGVKRLVMAIAFPAIAAGPNATRIGALGVTQA